MPKGNLKNDIIKGLLLIITILFIVLLVPVILYKLESGLSQQTIIYLKNISRMWNDLWNILVTIPSIILLIAILIILEKVYVYCNKISINGLDLYFKSPDKYFMSQMQNFLNTKRTLFFFRESQDNIYETLESYYNTYQFIRDCMKVYEHKEDKNRYKYYLLANELIKVLNNFLTKYQNNFIRWYSYKIDKEQNKTYNMDIFDLQKEYRHYGELIKGFKELNDYFIENTVNAFKVDVKKWQE